MQITSRIISKMRITPAIETRIANSEIFIVVPVVFYITIFGSFGSIMISFPIISEELKT